MHINTQVVLALMRLRGVPPDVLGNLLHVPYASLESWLGHDNEKAVDFDVQLEALRLLGIYNERPRTDLIHYWRLKEPFTGSSRDIYADLSTVLGSFGDAQVVHIARESDSSMSFKSKAHFGLRFKGFYAVLEVTGHPLRNLRFDPSVIPGLDWVDGVHCVMLRPEEYDRLEPGSMRVVGLQQHLSYNQNRANWDRLQEVAASHDMDPQALADLVAMVKRVPYTPSASAHPVERAAPVDLVEVPLVAPSPSGASSSARAVTPSEDDILMQSVPGSRR